MTDGTITHEYCFSGEKIKKTGEEGERHYIGGVEFNGSAIGLIHVPNGRILQDGSLQYNLTDHLDNVVVVFEDKSGDGEIQVEEITQNDINLEDEVIQRNHYYSFGMRVDAPALIDNGEEKNRYLYNGKEVADDYGLDWHYYGFRMYDASIGRFPSVDPIADQFAFVSGFNYAENSPVRYVDLWGLQKGGSWWERNRVGTRLWGGVQVIGGAIEIAGGGMLLLTPEPTALTKVGGYAVAAHGSDNVITGFQQIWTGKEQITFTQAGLQKIGLTERQAEIVDLVLGLGTGAATLAKAEKMIRLGKITRNSYHLGMKGLRKTADEMLANGASYEDIVRVISPARNNLKDLTRKAGDNINQGIAEYRNLKKYGDKLGPSIDDVIKKFTKDGKMDWKAAFDDIWKTSKDFDKFKK